MLTTLVDVNEPSPSSQFRASAGFQGQADASNVWRGLLGVNGPSRFLLDL